MTLWQSLPPEVRAVLVRLAGGHRISIPAHPDPEPGERIRAEHDCNMRVYGMTEGESIRNLAKRHHCTHGEIKRFL